MITATDLFCGAGGSSLGAEAVRGVELRMAANHWATAIELHQHHFPHAGHDLADISAADPRRYPCTDILIASPECTNHSQARGVSRKLQDPSLWDAPDPAAVRSRATMWDVPRFAEQNRYAAIIVENVVEATKWVGWRAWRIALEDLGYDLRVLSVNSMHHQVPQSRDRIYVVGVRNGIKVDLGFHAQAWCARCDAIVECGQAWKNGRSVGRYRQQWTWRCSTCGGQCEPLTPGAVEIIDWALPCPRIGDRAKPLAAATRARILAGLQRYGWVPITTAGAGNTHERTPGNRARPVTDPLPVQQASATHAVATAPGFMVATGHHHDGPGARIHDLGQPHPTVCASDDRLSMVVPLRRNSSASDTDGPVPTVCASGGHHGLLITNNPNNVAHPVADPLATVTTAGNRHALLMRNYRARGDDGQMSTPLTEPARTMTTSGNQSLLLPYYRTGQAQPLDRPTPTVTTTDRCAVIDVEALVDDCGFRMLEPHEIAAAMAFPVGYIPNTLTKRDRVKLAGNAVTPPVMTAIVERVRDALEASA